MVTSVAGAERTVVLELDGVQWASQKHVGEAVLRRRPGVVAAEANPVAQTVSVRYAPADRPVRCGVQRSKCTPRLRA